MVPDCAPARGPALALASPPRVGAPEELLDAPPASAPERVAGRLRRHRPFVVALGSFVAAYVLLALVLGAFGLLLTHVLMPHGVGPWDEHINRWLADHRVAVLNTVTSDGTFLADTVPIVAVTAVVSIGFLFARRWREAFLIVSALLLEFFVFLTVNLLIDRNRPDVPRLDSTPATASYPSGHIAAIIAVWGGLALVVTALTRRAVPRVAAWAVAVLLAVLVGFARVYRGMHHLTDVLAGAALGIGALLLALFGVRVTSAVVERRGHDAPDEAVR